jgi:diphthamide biosynthesis protein 4
MSGNGSIDWLIIKAKMNFYQVLQVDSSCSQGEIRHAYHMAARKFHPDKTINNGLKNDAKINKFSNDERQFLYIQEAYETLRDQELRAQYDLKLRQEEATLKRDCEDIRITDEISLSEMRREIEEDEDGEQCILYTSICRCGDVYAITEEEIFDGVDIVACIGCSLHIRVVKDLP